MLFVLLMGSLLVVDAAPTTSYSLALKNTHLISSDALSHLKRFLQYRGYHIVDDEQTIELAFSKAGVSLRREGFQRRFSIAAGQAPLAYARHVMASLRTFQALWLASRGTVGGTIAPGTPHPTARPGANAQQRARSRRRARARRRARQRARRRARLRARRRAALARSAPRVQPEPPRTLPAAPRSRAAVPDAVLRRPPPRSPVLTPVLRRPAPRTTRRPDVPRAVATPRPRRSKGNLASGLIRSVRPRPLPKPAYQRLIWVEFGLLGGATGPLVANAGSQQWMGGGAPTLALGFYQLVLQLALPIHAYPLAAGRSIALIRPRITLGWQLPWVGRVGPTAVAFRLFAGLGAEYLLQEFQQDYDAVLGWGVTGGAHLEWRLFRPLFFVLKLGVLWIPPINTERYPLSASVSLAYLDASAGFLLRF